jgi:transporter family protein
LRLSPKKSASRCLRSTGEAVGSCIGISECNRAIHNTIGNKERWFRERRGDLELVLPLQALDVERLPINLHAMAPWFWYAVAAAVLYGAHQIFTRLAADRIGEGLGGFVVEATAALSILLYLAFLFLTSRWNQKASAEGIFYSVLTGLCVGAGTIAFFLLFQKGGPLSAVPVILAVGAAMMAVAVSFSFANRRRGRD